MVHNGDNNGRSGSLFRSYIKVIKTIASRPATRAMVGAMSPNEEWFVRPFVEYDGGGHNTRISKTVIVQKRGSYEETDHFYFR